MNKVPQHGTKGKFNNSMFVRTGNCSKKKIVNMTIIATFVSNFFADARIRVVLYRKLTNIYIMTALKKLLRRKFIPTIRFVLGAERLCNN